jgi:hypothetical protein
MFLLTTIVYPCVFALVCFGAGLAVDRASGRFLPAVMLPAVGAAALIGVSQLTTYVPFAAPATPYVFAALGAGGIALEWRRVRSAARRWRSRGWQLSLPVLVYLLALAPVLASGHTSFSAYQVLTDSAFHMMGADYLIRHGQDYAHLDLRNSYGLYIHGYYGTGYPSGADTLFGGSAFLLGLPLIWTFQPFNALMLATAVGPAWVLTRRMGLTGAWAALAAASISVPALVYAYELIGSVKEITALPMIMTLGALVVLRDRWLRGPPRRAAPFALAAAGGVSALGVGFGAWVLASGAVLVAVLVADVAKHRQRGVAALTLVGAGAGVAALAALPTWLQASASAKGTATVAATSNPGNLVPGGLQTSQVFGTWLVGLYTAVPTGTAAVLTYAVIAVTVIAALLGAQYLLVIRQDVFAGWLAGLVLIAIALFAYATTWIDAKTLMLSSPIILLLSWGGVAALVDSRHPFAAALLALVLAGGVLASDAVQYHATDLAPAPRYTELASLDSRFAGKGPTLFSDFDEYSLYELRNLDVGGPDFLFPPPALADVPRPGPGGRHGEPVDLNRISPKALLAYPLIITRVDPLASRPPSAYRLLWQGLFYEVWGRRRHAPAAFGHLAFYRHSLAANLARCPSLARTAARHHGHLVAALAPQIVAVDFATASPRVADTHDKLNLLAGSGRVAVRFSVPHAGRWDLWLLGEIMPAVEVSIDGHPGATIADQLSGNSSTSDPVGPFGVTLAAGRHRLTFTDTGSSLAPGAGGDALLTRVFLTPAGSGERDQLRSASAADWPSLCSSRFEWIEAVPN